LNDGTPPLLTTPATTRIPSPLLKEKSLIFDATLLMPERYLGAVNETLSGEARGELQS